MLLGLVQTPEILINFTAKTVTLSTGVLSTSRYLWVGDVCLFVEFRPLPGQPGLSGKNLRRPTLSRFSQTHSGYFILNRHDAAHGS